MTSLLPFQGPEHRPYLRHGAGAGAALLIHGFPGTPAETRPLARLLHQAGWTVQGLLLPGFGPEIAGLADRRHRDWTAAVERAHADLAREHGKVLLAGYSMGAALAVTAAARRPAAGLALFAPFHAPFHRLNNRLHDLLWPVIRLLIPRLRPFEKADFSDPELAQQLAGIPPAADLGDPQVQAELRAIALPSVSLHEARAAGRLAWRLAPRAAAPALVLGAEDDPVVPLAQVRALAERLPGPVDLRQVAGGHALLDPQGPAWPAVEEAMREFLGRIG